MINIILEGIDKSGKTTLANQLLSEFEFDYFKCSQPKGDPYLEYMTVLKNIKRSTIIDRFHWGELVYGPLYRGKNQLSREQFLNIELKALSLNSTIVYCYADQQVIKQRFFKEQEQFTQHKHINKILTSYKRISKLSVLPIITHDALKHNSLVALIKIIRDQNNKQDHLDLRGLVVGNIKKPRVLFIGLQNNKNSSLKLNQLYSTVRTPFDFGPSSKRLKEAIELSNLKFNEVCITNLNDKLNDLISIVKPKSIIALGQVVHQHLSGLEIKHETIEHPSFNSRFHHHQLKNYANKIKLFI